jgi:transposase
VSETNGIQIYETKVTDSRILSGALRLRPKCRLEWRFPAGLPA